MANRTIPELTGAGALAGTDVVHIVDGDGNSRKMTLAALKTFINTDPTVVPASEPYRGARVRRTSNLSIANNVATLVTWQTADVDTDSIWAAGAPTRLTVPTGVTQVRLAYSSSWDSASGVFDVMIYKNGAVFHGMARSRFNTGGASTNRFNIVSSVVPAVAGDYFEARVIQASGTALNMLADETSWFAMDIVQGAI